MATLEKIRKRGPLVALIVGLALFAFILGDIFKSFERFISGDRFEIATVAGKSIQLQDYQNKVNEVAEIYKLRTGQQVNENLMEQIRTSVWEEMIREKVMSNELKELGVEVSPEELFDMVNGKNVDPVIRQSFSDPQTGQFNPAMVIQFLKEMDNDPSGNSKRMWMYLENQIKNNRVYTKYNNLVAKGLFVTKQEVETEFKERNYIVDFQFVAKPYSSISDSAVKVTDAELKDYYKKHEKEFEQEEARDIIYVTFDVVPSKEDSAVILKDINDLKAGFESTKDIKAFVSKNSDSKYEERSYKKGEYTSNPLIDSLMTVSPAGTVFGPVVENNAYRLLRLTDVKEKPDSVKARHILIQADGTMVKDIARAKQIADSLKVVLGKKEDFAKLAEKYSADKNANLKGGDLGFFTEGMMVKEFSDPCFNGKKGDVFVVETQFGVHVVEITDQTKPVKKYTLAVLDRTLEPSQKTYQAIYAKASEFGSKNRTKEAFETAATQNSLLVRTAPNLLPATNFIPGLESPREMIRWAFKAEKNEISVIYEFGNRFVIAALTEIKNKGIAPLEQVKDRVEILVKQEKKAELILKDAAGLTSIESAASKFQTASTEVKNVSFTAFQIQGAGYEPEVIAFACSLEKDKVSKPIKGKNGVYVIKVTSITPFQNTQGIDLSNEKIRLVRSVQSRASYQAFDALKKVSDITDKRAEFF